MPPDAQPAVGDRIVTSGHGGLVPPGLPVGTVASVADRLVKVQPLVDLARIDHVEIVDFGLAGGINLEGGVPGALP
jgi:rod shape-determining protein MreC